MFCEANLQHISIQIDNQHINITGFENSIIYDGFYLRFWTTTTFRIANTIKN